MCLHLIKTLRLDRRIHDTDAIKKKVKQKIGLLYLAKGGGLTLDKTIWSKYPPPIPKSLFLHAEIQMRECKYFTTEQMLNTAGNDAKGTFKNELL